MNRFVLTLITLLLAVLPTCAQSDTAVVACQKVAAIRFGYVSCDSVLHAMPEYAIARKNLAELQSKYDAEMKRVEDEFNLKYEMFLEGQRDFAPSILQKRQAELQELMEKNKAFKLEARRLMAEAEKEAIDPIKKKVSENISKAATAKGLAFVINTDGNALPFANPATGEDITSDVIAAAK